MNSSDKLSWFYIKHRIIDIDEGWIILDDKLGNYSNANNHLEHDEFEIKIVNQDYETLFETTVLKDDFKLFIKIMSNDKYALLEKEHPLLGPAASIKLSYKNGIIQPKMEIVSAEIEQLINDYLNLQN